MDTKTLILKEKLWKLYSIRNELEAHKLSDADFDQSSEEFADSLQLKIIMLESELDMRLKSERKKIEKDLNALELKRKEGGVSEGQYVRARAYLKKREYSLNYLVELLGANADSSSVFSSQRKERRRPKKQKPSFKWFIILGVVLLIGYSVVGLFFVEQRSVIGGMQISDNWTIAYEGRAWQLEVNAASAVEYKGRARAVSRNNDRDFPMITNDLVVGSGDYGQEGLVSVRIRNHKAKWDSELENPSGDLYMLCLIPADAGVYSRIKGIREGSMVVVEGYAIEGIKNLETQKSWRAPECSKVLVTGVYLVG